MRPVEFTPEQIIQAGQDLQSSGRNITGFALRQKVGGGNPSRLKQVWDEHLAGRSVTTAEPVAELPIEVAEEVANVTKTLTERLANLAVELNDKAVKAAERRVHEVVRSAGEQREQAERELVDAAQTVDELENKLDEALTEGAGWRTQFSVLTQTHQAQAVELAQVRERLAQIEQASKQSSEQHAAEVARLNDGIEAERQRHHVALADLNDVMGELATVKAQAVAADQVHQEQRKTAAAEAHRTTERLVKIEAERDQANKEAGASREDAAKLRGQVEAMQSQVADLMRAIEARQPVEPATTPAEKPAKAKPTAKKPA